MEVSYCSRTLRPLPATAMVTIEKPPDTQSPLQQPDTRSYAQAIASKPVSAAAPVWFKFQHIPLPTRTLSIIDSEPACLFTPIQYDQSAKQFEHALIMKFSVGRADPYDIKLHIKLHWGLSAEPVVSLIDPRHVLVLPATYQDMVLALEVHKIANYIRLYRWSKYFVFGKDDTLIPVWVRLPYLPFIYFNPAFFLQ